MPSDDALWLLNTAMENEEKRASLDPVRPNTWGVPPTGPASPHSPPLQSTCEILK